MNTPGCSSLALGREWIFNLFQKRIYPEWLYLKLYFITCTFKEAKAVGVGRLSTLSCYEVKTSTREYLSYIK